MKFKNDWLRRETKFIEAGVWPTANDSYLLLNIVVSAKCMVRFKITVCDLNVSITLLHNHIVYCCNYINAYVEILLNFVSQHHKNIKNRHWLR